MPFEGLSRQHIDRFFETITPWRSGLVTPRVQFIAVKEAVKEQRRHSVFAARFVLTNMQDAREDRLFKTERVWAGDFSCAVSPEELVEELGEGRLRTPIGLIDFPSDSNGHRAFLQKYNPQTPAMRGTLLQITGGSVGNPLSDNDLDWELKAAPAPYQNISELMIDFGLSGVTQNYSTVEVLALPATVFDGSSAVSGVAARPVVHLAKGLDVQGFRLGVIELMHGRPVRRFSIDAKEFSWQDIEPSQRGTVEFVVPEGSALCCIANYRDQAHAIRWLMDPLAAHNPRRAAYAAFDPGLNVLSDSIVRDEIKKGDARDFEIAICTLFWMLGFSGANVGGARRTSDAPDLLFNTPDGHFAVVECTTGNLKAGSKLANIVERTERVRSALRSSGSQHLRVLPVIVTCATREAVATDLDQANRNGVYVITRSELVALIEQTIAPFNPNQLFENAEKQIQAHQQFVAATA